MEERPGLTSNWKMSPFMVIFRYEPSRCRTWQQDSWKRPSSATFCNKNWVDTYNSYLVSNIFRNFVAGSVEYANWFLIQVDAGCGTSKQTSTALQAFDLFTCIFFKIIDCTNVTFTNRLQCNRDCLFAMLICDNNYKLKSICAFQKVYSTSTYYYYFH